MSRPLVIACLFVAACTPRPPARAPAPRAPDATVERSTALRLAGDWTTATAVVERALDGEGLDADTQVRLLVELACR